MSGIGPAPGASQTVGGSTLPASPTPRQVFMKTSGGSEGLYICFSAGTWLLVEANTGAGTVTSVSVTTANGVSGVVATATTTPAITLTLGAITPTSVNKVTITAPATSATLTIPDGVTLNAGTGGTLGSAAFTSSGAYLPVGGTAVAASAVALGGITGAGTGILTALAVNVGSVGAPVLFNGDAGTPSALVGTNLSGTASGLTAGNATLAANLSGTPTLPNGTAATTQSQSDSSTKLATTAYVDTGLATKQATITFGTGVLTALGVNVGSAGAPVVNGGALGTPSSGTVTNLTGTASININGTVGATTPAAVTATTLTSTGNTQLADAVTDTVSIGTAAPATVTLLNQFFVGQSVSIDGASGTAKQAEYGHNFYYNAGFKYRVSDFAGKIAFNNDSAGNIEFLTAPTGTADNAVTFGSVFKLGNTGAITLNSGVTNSAGTPGSLCYNTSTFEMTKNNALTCTVSSRLFKKGISSFVAALPILNKLRAVQFAYKDQPKRRRLGFIAEELAKVDRRLADNYDKQGRALSIDQNALLGLAVEAIQELEIQNQVLNERLETLYAR